MTLALLRWEVRLIMIMINGAMEIPNNASDDVVAKCQTESMPLPVAARSKA